MQRETDGIAERTGEEHRRGKRRRPSGNNTRGQAWQPQPSLAAGAVSGGVQTPQPCKRSKDTHRLCRVGGRSGAVRRGNRRKNPRRKRKRRTIVNRQFCFTTEPLTFTPGIILLYPLFCLFSVCFCASKLFPKAAPEARQNFFQGKNGLMVYGGAYEPSLFENICIRVDSIGTFATTVPLKAPSKVPKIVYATYPYSIILICRVSVCKRQIVPT